MTPAERGDLAERMVFKAARLATVVHGDGGQQDVENLLGHLDRTELLGLVVVLAGIVDPDVTVERSLGYLTWDENGHPVRQDIPPCTLRQLAGFRTADYRHGVAA